MQKNNHVKKIAEFILIALKSSSCIVKYVLQSYIKTCYQKSKTDSK